MYLIKERAQEINALELDENDVISINKKWYVIREKLGLLDELKLYGLRDQINYTMKAIIGFGKVDSFRKVGRVVEDRLVEDLNIERKSIVKSMINEELTEDA